MGVMYLLIILPVAVATLSCEDRDTVNRQCEENASTRSTIADYYDLEDIHPPTQETRNVLDTLSVTSKYLDNAAQKEEKIDTDSKNTEKKDLSTNFVFSEIDNNINSLNSNEYSQISVEMTNLTRSQSAKNVKEININNTIEENTKTSTMSTDGDPIIMTNDLGIKNSNNATLNGNCVSAISEKNLNESHSTNSKTFTNLNISILVNGSQNNENFQTNSYNTEQIKETEDVANSSLSYELHLDGSSKRDRESDNEDCDLQNNSTVFIFEAVHVGEPSDSEIKSASALFQRDSQPPTRSSNSRISAPLLEFPDVPEGESFHIQEQGLSEGLFVFSYISSFLSWIQPYDFPVELLRDALWKRVSVVDLITQSLQVEVGFIVCLSVGVLLALGVPCILVSHACCRLLDSNKRNSGWTEESPNDTTNECAVTCRRCTLVFVMQLILVLLVAGIVSMFVTNEQMSRAVDQTPSVVHTALNDVTTFLRNSHQQLRFVITKSLDQSVDATNTDLDNVEELLGRPIQEELATETGVDVALDALIDVSAEARTMSSKVEALLVSCEETRELLVESRERLADLRMDVDTFRRQCPSRFRPLCDTVDSAGLDVVLRLEPLMADDRLAQIRDLRDGNLSLVTQQARGEFQFIPLRVEKETRGARNGVKRQLTRQKEVLYDSIWSLDVVTRDLTYKIEDARNQALQIVGSVSAVEQWRWLIGFGAAISVLLIWLLLLSGISCGCCGSKERATPTLLASVVLICIFSVALWGIALGALLVGGHGEVFICRPLYDEPEYIALTRLVDRPGVLFQKGGGFFSNLLYGNNTLDVPLRDVLQKCKENGSTYSAFSLKQVFDVDAASNHRRWDPMYTELQRLHVNLTDLQLLTPDLQQHLQALLYATTVNLTNYRAQMTGQVTGKDLSSFADQMMSVANQITDRTTLSRLDTLSSSTRQLITSHIQPLEQRKEDLIYQLTALEMQMTPLQRQVNQSLSHLKTIQYFINNQGSNIAYEKSLDYTNRLVSYMDQYRTHVLNTTQQTVAPCRPVWNLYHAMRLLFCRHIVDPLNGFWFATVWCLLLFLAATPPCLKLVDHYRLLKQSNSLLHSRSSESPSETLMISEQGAPWTTPGAPEPDGW